MEFHRNPPSKAFAILFDVPAERIGSCQFPTLNGRRVCLRPMRPSDLKDLLELRGDPLTARYQSWSRFDEAAAKVLIEAAGSTPIDVPGKWAQGAIARIADDRLIGDCAVSCLAADVRQSEIGFNLKTAERGCGYAAEAVEMLVSWLFSERRKRRVFAVTDRRNQPSRNLLERIGFRAVPEAYRLVFFKDEWEGESVYERLA